ncbi:MAG: DUF4157 domain-containing protein, partial [Bacteroidia bacterium]
HTGSEAADLSSSINARAFAHGKDIFFKDDVSEELLAHEVVHTVQFDEESAMLSRVFDQTIYDERKPIYDKCMKEGSYFSGFTKKLVTLYGDPAYGIKELQANFFEKGTSFTTTIDSFGHQYGLWPNLILIYYLLDETWTPTEGYPLVKSFVAPDGKFVILSTFKGQIYLQKDVKNGGSEPNDNSTITAYNHIAVNGLQDKASGGFYLYNDETLYNNAIALDDQLGFKLLEDVKDGNARKLGYHLKVSQFQTEYNILRANGYSKSIDQFLAEPVSLRDFLEGGKLFKNVSISGIVKNEDGVKMRKTPFTPDDITRLGKAYEGPEDNFIEIIPFNTRLTVLRQTVDPDEQWAYVKTENGKQGYVSLVYVEIEMPESKASYHRVQEDETMQSIADHYRGKIDAHDFILLLNALNPTQANKKLTLGHLLWIPSQDFAMKKILAMPLYLRNTRTDKEFKNETEDRAKKIYEALEEYDRDAVVNTLKGLTTSQCDAIRDYYNKAYSPIRKNGDFYTDLYNSLTYASIRYAAFSSILPPNAKENVAENQTLRINGLENSVAPVGSDFSVSYGPIRAEVSSQNAQFDRVESAVIKYPDGRVDSYFNSNVIEISDAEEGNYDFIVFIEILSSKKIIPLRIQQKVADISKMTNELMGQFDAQSYSNFLLSLELQKISIGGGVTRDQFAGVFPYISLTHDTSENPSDWQHIYQTTSYTVHPSEKGKKYKWYARQISRTNPTQAAWTPPAVDGSKNKSFGGYLYNYIGDGLTQNVSLSLYGHLSILAEEYDASNQATGEVAQYIHYVFEGGHYEHNNDPTDPNADDVKYQKINWAIKDAQTYIKKIKGNAVSVKAAYINGETGNEMVIPLFIGKSANTDEGKYVLVDLLPGLEERLYYGDTPEACLDRFDSRNKYPTGMIFLQITKNKENIPELSKHYETDGWTTWEKFSSTTGWIALGMGLLGLALEFVPGGQVAGGYLIIASMTLGAVSGAASLYDRMQNATVDKGGVAIDILTIVGSIMAGGGQVFKMAVKAGQVGRLGAK